MKQSAKRRAQSGKGMGLKRERAKARKERDSHFLLFSPFSLFSPIDAMRFNQCNMICARD